MTNDIKDKTEIKLLSRKNVIPITSISDLGIVVNEIQNQLNILISKPEDNTTPEFKALMEGYVKKANEVEELKVNIENFKSQHEELKSEINKVRETNRNLIHELQSAREALKNLEYELNIFQATSNKSEEEYKIKIKSLNEQIRINENTIKELEDESIKVREEFDIKAAEIINENERLKQECQEQNFKSRQAELELTSERDSLKKQVKEFEILLKEQHEQIELKSKEIEYKDALINQLIKQATTDKLPAKSTILSEETRNMDNKNKRKNWFLK